MRNSARQTDHEELELLLPWFVNGTLDADNRARVEAHLDDCTDCRAGVALLRDVQRVSAADTPSPIVPKSRLDDLFDEIDRTVPESRKRKWRYGVAAAAAAALFGILIVAANLLPETARRVTFETATTGQPENGLEYVLSIQFGADVPKSRRSRVIAEIGGTETGPGELPDTYELVVPASDATLEELQRFTLELEALEDVRAVNVVGVQLPVR